MTRFPRRLPTTRGPGRSARTRRPMLLDGLHRPRPRRGRTCRRGRSPRSRPTPRSHRAETMACHRAHTLPAASWPAPQAFTRSWRTRQSVRRPCDRPHPPCGRPLQGVPRTQPAFVESTPAEPQPRRKKPPSRSTSRRGSWRRGLLRMPGTVHTGNARSRSPTICRRTGQSVFGSFIWSSLPSHWACWSYSDSQMLS